MIACGKYIHRDYIVGRAGLNDGTFVPLLGFAAAFQRDGKGKTAARRKSSFNCDSALVIVRILDGQQLVVWERCVTLESSIYHNWRTLRG